MNNWIHLNRQSRETILVIPGWAIMPLYFIELWKEANLYILNPFLSRNETARMIDEMNLECKALMANLDELLSKELTCLHIFSMGLQWIAQTGNKWKQFPCLIESPAQSYDHSVVDALKTNLNKSKVKTLKSFYRQACGSSKSWQWWKETMLDDHLERLNKDCLDEWLDQNSCKQVEISDANNVNVILDVNDQIGQKPNALNYKSSHLIQHEYGHISSPIQHEALRKLLTNVKL